MKDIANVAAPVQVLFPLKKSKSLNTKKMRTFSIQTQSKTSKHLFLPLTKRVLLLPDC